MAPSNLHGLNIIHPTQSNFDSQDLLSGPPFPDLAAQLDLWTNLPFESEEGPMHRHDGSYHKKGGAEEEEEEEHNRNVVAGKEVAIHDGHINVVTGTNLGSNQQGNAFVPPPAFDIGAFLAGFGIDPFAAQQLQQAQSPATIAPSLAQLLTLHSVQNAAVTPRPSTQSSTQSQSSPESESSPYPPAKRSRTRKASVSTVDDAADAVDTSENGGGPLSASEDKRRRNTAASARFRMKKKEREAALEGKAKELETRVNELERECEGLRRENGWLKGLVVGVTGAAQGGAGVVQTQPSTGTKRSRDEDSA